MLCQECQSRSICQSECPELTLHFKEIEGIQKELPIGNPRYGKFPWSSSIYLTKTERQILRLKSKGLDNQTICEVAEITINSLYAHLSNLKKKYIES